jgi:hypothetical protein
VERVADLPVPRGGHKTILSGDEVVLLGGLTNGYKNMESADYYADGTWHTVPMLYTHVNGFLAPLPDGRFLIGGGSQEDFGSDRVGGPKSTTLPPILSPPPVSFRPNVPSLPPLPFPTVPS